MEINSLVHIYQKRVNQERNVDLEIPITVQDFVLCITGNQNLL